ncbi:MAG: hypothetical protein M0Z57_07095 [Deltaproteobacteria bacterium]|jgi:hypothetical protein|nr:hypothetical protein [Deltaproteobacteria bacterium]
MDIEEIINGKTSETETGASEQENDTQLDLEQENEPETTDLPFKSKSKIKKIKLLAVIAILIVLAVIGLVVFKSFISRPKSFVIPPIQPKTNFLVHEIYKVKGNKPAVKEIQNKPEPAAKPLTSVALKKQTKKSLNDLFKLKSAPVNKKAVISPSPMPSYGQVPAPNFNGIPPNVLQNIRSRINGEINETPPRPEVLGVSNKFAVIQYGGADLYLKTGDSFGSCTVLSINSNNVKIVCNSKAKSYPVEFVSNTSKTKNQNVAPVNLPGVKK